MKYSKREYEKVFERLAYTCDAPLSGHLFQMAIDQGHVDAYLDDSIEIDDLAFIVDGYTVTVKLSDNVRRADESPQAKSEFTERPLSHRSHALNAILAIEAADRSDVVSFRSRNLEDGLLDINNVASWIERAAEDDGPATVWITIPEEALSEARVTDKSALSRLPGYGEDTHLLRYVTGGARFTHSIPIRHEGTLADLAETSHWVAVHNGWREAATTTFILTGLPPAAVGIRAHRAEPWPYSDHRRRIGLDIPLSATLDDVGQTFLRLRNEMLGDKRRSRRSLTKRSADLAVFAAEHATGHKWDEARGMWNDQHLDAEGVQYEDTTLFTRDSRAAYERVTGKRLKWNRKRNTAFRHANQPKET